MSFDELSLRNLREVDRTRIVPVGALKCQHCAAPLVIKAPGQSQSVVCGHCGSIADPTDPNVAILQKATKRTRVEPRIPLGSGGEWHGAHYEVIGFQRREITVGGTDYGWHEYVLFNPQHGFRYLSEYDGHWNDIAVLDENPEGHGLGPHTTRELRGRSFRHFQSAEARTVFVLGEFPWVVKVGEQVHVHDYVSPPYLLSAEGTATDSTWSLGTYVQGEALWQAFSVEGQPPPAVGVFANQPSPVTHGWTYWRMFAGLAALLILVAFARMTLSGSTVFNGSFRFDPSATSPAFVTEPFELSGRTSNVDVSLDSNLSNNWMLVNLALINEETGVALDFGRALEYLLRRRRRRIVVRGLASRQRGVADRAGWPLLPSRRAGGRRRQPRAGRLFHPGASRSAGLGSVWHRARAAVHPTIGGDIAARLVRAPTLEPERLRR